MLGTCKENKMLTWSAVGGKLPSYHCYIHAYLENLMVSDIS